MTKAATLLLCTFLLAGMPTIAGCSSQTYDSKFWHQNFVSILHNTVGRTLASARSGGWAPETAFISRTDLSNGDVAYKYRYQGTCRYTFEVDPKTDIIVAASWEGEARHCIVVP